MSQPTRHRRPALSVVLLAVTVAASVLTWPVPAAATPPLVVEAAAAFDLAPVSFEAWERRTHPDGTKVSALSSGLVDLPSQNARWSRIELTDDEISSEHVTVVRGDRVGLHTAGQTQWRPLEPGDALPYELGQVIDAADWVAHWDQQLTSDGARQLTGRVDPARVEATLGGSGQVPVPDVEVELSFDADGRLDWVAWDETLPDGGSLHRRVVLTWPASSLRAT